MNNVIIGNIHRRGRVNINLVGGEGELGKTERVKVGVGNMFKMGLFDKDLLTSRASRLFRRRPLRFYAVHVLKISLNVLSPSSMLPLNKLSLCN